MKPKIFQGVVLAATLFGAAAAYAEPNVITQVLTAKEGGRTIVTVRGSATPSFTAYRLERPSRVVVDLADGRMQGVEGPIDVDSWAVGQIAVAQYQDVRTRTARVMIAFRRPSTYDVRADGRDVVITITPDESPPAAVAPTLSPATLAAAAESARKVAQQQKDEQNKLALLQHARGQEEARLAQLREARAAEERSADRQRLSVVAEEQAAERAERARESAALAAAAAADAQKELARVVDARRAEEARLEDLRRSQSATTQSSRAELAQLKQEQVARAAQVVALKRQAEQQAAESQALLERRTAETRKLEETQRTIEKQAAAREAKLAADRRALDDQVAAARASLTTAAEHVQKQTIEAARLRAESMRLRDTQKDAAAKRAEALAAQIAESTRRESEKLAAVRRQIADAALAADAVRADLALARAEREKLAAAQQKERALAVADQHEAERLANLRQLEAERAAHAAALASASEENMQKAERDAQRVVATRMAESARLATLQKETAREAEHQRTEAARLQALLAGATQKTAAKERELADLQNARSAEESALEHAQKERRQLVDQVASAKAELERVKSDLKTRLAVVPTPHATAAAVQPELAHIDDVQVAGNQVRLVIAGAKSVEHTILRMDDHTALLRLAHADLPAHLERTLDASQLGGTIDRVSSYRDRRDPGTVRIEVHFSDAAIEPRLAIANGALSWEFARPELATEAAPSGLTTSQPASQIYAPQRVGAFGPPVALDAAPANLTLPPNPSNAGRRRKVYTGRRIDLDFKDVDIHNLMRLLSDIGQVNVVMSDDVKGTITVRMRDVPWDQALDVILKSKSLGMTREGNLIRVAPADKLEKEVEQEIARSKAQIELKPIDTRLIYLSYADAKDILPRVQDVMSPRGKVSFDARTNTLIVSDVGSNIALAEDLVRNLDTQTPQIQIEARIVESTTNFTRDIGIQWGGSGIASSATGNPTGIVFPSTVGVAGGAVDQTTNVNGLLNGQAASPNYVVNMPAAVGTGAGGALGVTLGSVAGNVNINLRLSALENTGNVRIVSAPKIMALDNIEASIEQGTSIPISVVSAAGTNTVFVDAKLNLTVKPHVTNEGSVIMSVSITRNEPDFVNTGARGDPTILKKQAHTQMLVRDGDTAVIGGIYTRNTGLQFTKVPWLADIPVLGWLFKNRKENDDRTELLIFLTPRIVNRSPTARR